MQAFPFLLPAINSAAVIIKQQTEVMQRVLTEQFSLVRYK